MTTPPQQAQRVFQYLREFTQLKSRPQRTNKGDSVLWLYSLPEDPRIANVIHTPSEAAGEDWLVVQKPRFVPAPVLPAELEPWVSGSLDQPDQPPRIRPQIAVDAETEDADIDKSAKVLRLEEQSAVQGIWKKFEATWQTWAETERRAREVQKVYSQLFDFHQKLSTESERYELSLGLGHLVWNAPSSGEVRRHLLTARAALQFDALRGILSVGASGDGARTALEQDMLDASDRVSPKVQELIQEALLEAGEDLWSGETLQPLLQTWVNSVDDRGLYSDTLRPVQGVTDKPVVHWAPALLLRRRGERALTAAYDGILGQLGEAEVPDSISRFLGERSTAVSQADSVSGDSTVYFPLPANDAQQDIIRRIRHEPGILVQGPPGTGKSHTIVNLVSHLLATDQKVLVTSHTARALSVLREKFPAELRSLCVTHLRGEEGAQAALQGSVGEILSRFTHRNSAQEKEQEKVLFSRLEQARQQEDRLLDKLRQIREAETGVLDLHGYRGSAQQIATQLKAQESQFEWLTELSRPDSAVPLTNSEALRLLELLCEIDDDEAELLNQTRPAVADLTLAKDFLQLAHEEQHAKNQTAEYMTYQKHAGYALLMQASPEARNQILRTVQTLAAAAETERTRPFPWIAEALGAVLREQAGRWDEVARQSAQLLPELLERVDWLEQQGVAGLEGRDLATVRSDAEAVHEHLSSGGSWGNFLIKPAAVKTRQYLRTDVRIAGQAADRPETLQALLDYLHLSDNLDKLRSLWSSQGVQISGPLKMQVLDLEAQAQPLKQVLGLRTELAAARQAVQGVMGLVQPRWWEVQELQELIGATQAAQLAHDEQARTGKVNSLLLPLQNLKLAGGAHPVVSEIIQAIENRDADRYAQASQQLEALEERAYLLSERQALLSDLERLAPDLTDALLSDVQDEIWYDRLATLEEAWNWVQADLRITELANPDTEVEVRDQLAAARAVQRQTLGELAATKAWRSTLDRMTSREQAALVRWQNAVRKIGKGTGKNAGKWRKVAQDSLKEAHTAIPAWIMPLHLVAENFSLRPGMFDVVIVDEASQAGPEALFLTFIAKKIIIVGDDKQIEPENVGIQTAQVEALVQRYLWDVPAPEVIGDARASLFGFGSYAYPTRINLREHFRCMPEIIKFSSDLSYPHEPLIPLRQFGTERLTPLVARHVEDGYTLPVRGAKVNPTEARAIVDQIKACIANPRYARKTMGVISLLGDSQAEEIATLLRAEVSEAELEARQLICGNAYSFQGDERDVMFLSMVASPSDGRREPKVGRDSATFQPRYNVAASRARDQLWLFHSVDLSDLHPEDLRASLIQHVRNPEMQGWRFPEASETVSLRELAARSGRGKLQPPGKFDSWFEVDVYLDLIDRGYRVIPQYELSGYRIDLVVEGLRGRLAVECDGDYWHGPDKYLDDLARQQTLERAGMEFWRVRGSTYARDPEGALEDLWHTLEKRGIFPEGDPRNHQAADPELVLPPAEDEEPSSMEVPAEAAYQAEEAAQDQVAEQLEFSAVPSVPGLLAPYVSWSVRSLPDPRTLDGLEPVAAALQEIVSAEGPMSARQAYQVYCQAAGIRVGQSTKSLLNRAMSLALRKGALLAEDEWRMPGMLDKIVRAPGTPRVRLRELGSRKFADVPPSEVLELMSSLLSARPELESDPEALFRAALSLYGGQRLTQNARKVFERAVKMGEEAKGS